MFSVFFSPSSFTQCCANLYMTLLLGCFISMSISHKRMPGVGLYHGGGNRSVWVLTLSEPTLTLSHSAAVLRFHFCLASRGSWIIKGIRHARLFAEDRRSSDGLCLTEFALREDVRGLPNKASALWAQSKGRCLDQTPSVHAELTNAVAISSLARNSCVRRGLKAFHSV